MYRAIKRTNSRWADIITICACFCIELQRTNDGRLVWPEAITPTPLGPQIQMNSAPNHQQKPEEEEENRMFTSTFIEQNITVSRIPPKNGPLEKSKKNTTCSMFLNLEPSWIVVCSTVHSSLQGKEFGNRAFTRFAKWCLTKLKFQVPKLQTKKCSNQCFCASLKNSRAASVFSVYCALDLIRLWLNQVLIGFGVGKIQRIQSLAS